MTRPWEEEVVVSIADPGGPTERIVVHHAGRYVGASLELVQTWLSPERGPHVRVYGDGQVVEFGTPGEGLGEVRYRIGEVRRRDNAADLWAGLAWTRADFLRNTVTLTRIDDEEWGDGGA